MSGLPVREVPKAGHPMDGDLLAEEALNFALRVLKAVDQFDPEYLQVDITRLERVRMSRTGCAVEFGTRVDDEIGRLKKMLALRERKLLV
jgi:hypothetical protein